MKKTALIVILMFNLVVLLPALPQLHVYFNASAASSDCPFGECPFGGPVISNSASSALGDCPLGDCPLGGSATIEKVVR